MKKSRIILFIFSLLFLANPANAGFGISPARIENDILLRGSVLNKTIYLVQSNPSSDVVVNVNVVPSKISKWIEIEKGASFIIPKGVNQYPVNIKITIPKNINIGNYNGSVLFKTYYNKENSKEGTVKSMIGSEVNIDLKVINNEYRNFLINNLNVPNTVVGDSSFLIINAINKGNVSENIDKINIEVFDNKFNRRIKTINKNINNIVNPFSSLKTKVKFNSELSIGEYWLNVKAYRKGEIIKEDKIIFEVIPKVSISTIKDNELTVKREVEIRYKWSLIFSVSAISLYGIYLWIKRLKFNLKIKKDNINKKDE